MTPKAKKILFREFKASKYVAWRYHVYSNIRKESPEIWSVDILKWIMGQLNEYSPLDVANQTHIVVYARSNKCRIIGFVDKDIEKTDKEIERLKRECYIEFKAIYEIMTGLINTNEETLKILNAHRRAK